MHKIMNFGLPFLGNQILLLHFVLKAHIIYLKMIVDAYFVKKKKNSTDVLLEY